MANQPLSDHPAHQPVESLHAKVTRWYNLKAKVAELTAQEAELRAELAREAFPKAKEKGSERAPIGFGKDLKVTNKLNYTIDKAVFEAAKPNLPPDVLAAIVRYRPEVVESGLNAITDPQLKAVVATFITSRPALPTLEIVDVKKRD